MQQHCTADLCCVELELEWASLNLQRPGGQSSWAGACFIPTDSTLPIMPIMRPALVTTGGHVHNEGPTPQYVFPSTQTRPATPSRRATAPAVLTSPLCRPLCKQQQMRSNASSCTQVKCCASQCAHSPQETMHGKTTRCRASVNGRPGAQPLLFPPLLHTVCMARSTRRKLDMNFLFSEPPLFETAGAGGTPITSTSSTLTAWGSRLTAESWQWPVPPPQPHSPEPGVGQAAQRQTAWT